MKVIYIESRLKIQKYILTKKDLELLPKELFLAYSIQYKALAESIMGQLKANSIKIKGFSQVFGCSKIATKLPVLFIGRGRFHSQNLYLQAPRVFILENSILEVDKKEIEKMAFKIKGALLKFYTSKKIGILYSTKPGQTLSFDKIKRLKSDIEKKDKECYIFLADNIDISQFENFNIGSWVNTACIGLSYDDPRIINHSDLGI